jgi:hypothetical protein
MRSRIRPEPGLPDGCDRDTESFSKVPMVHPLKKTVRRFLEIHVCTSIDKRRQSYCIQIQPTREDHNEPPVPCSLVEGNSIRSAERMTDTHRDPVIRLLIEADECVLKEDREARGRPLPYTSSTTTLCGCTNRRA